MKLLDIFENETNQDILIDAFNWHVKQTGIISGINYVFRTNKTKEEVPELYEKIEERKDEILKILISSYVLRKQYMFVSTMLRQLKKMGFEWEELDAIEKSLRAINKLYENSYSSFSKHTFFMKHLIEAILKQHDFAAMDNFKELLYDSYDIVALIIEVQNDLMSLPPNNLKWFFELIKNKLLIGIVKRYKTALSDSDEVDIDYIIEVMDVLDYANIDWPELDAIKKSMRAEKLIKEDESREHEIRQYNIDRILEIIDVQLSNNESSFITWMYQLKSLGALPDVKPILEKRVNNMFAIIMNSITYLQPTVISELVTLLQEGGIQLPELYDNIQENKDEIVKRLLVRMKSVNSFKYYLINIILSSFYRMGINWEELRIIKHSIDVEAKKLKESNKSTGEKQIVDFAFYNFIKALQKNDIVFITYHLTDYIRNGGDTERVKKVINDKKDVFKQILREHAIGLSLNSFNELARVLQRKLHIYWPELELSHYKDVILKNMIFGFRHGDLARVYNDFTKLKDHRYDWPELDAIEKSLRAENMLKEDEIDIGIVSLIKQALIKNNISLALTRCSMFDLNQLKQAAHELTPLFEKRKHEVLQYLSSLAEKNKDYKQVIDKLVAIGIDWPELKSIQVHKLNIAEDLFDDETTRQNLEKQKDYILKQVLSYIVQGSYKEARDYVDWIRLYDIDWEELDTIDRSLESLVKSIDESLMQNGSELSNLSRTLLKAIQNHDIEWSSELFRKICQRTDDLHGQLLYVVRHVKDHAKWFFESQKTWIIQELLQLIRDYDFRYMPKDEIRVLKKVGIDWPELDIIQRSIDADNKINTERNYEE